MNDLTARFDVIVKYVAAIRLLKNNRLEWDDLTKNLYEEHINIMTSGTFREESGNKKSLTDYMSSYADLIHDFKNENFNPLDKIPVDKNGNPWDGAHRIASALIFKKELDFERIDTNSEVDYGYSFFLQNKYKYLSYVVDNFLQLNRNYRLALVWPSNEHQELIVNKLPSKKILFEVDWNDNCAHQAVALAYFGEEWLGDPETNFRGAWDKVYECFKIKKTLKIIIFDPEERNLVAFKNQLREVGKNGKHSIHITDSYEETHEKSLLFLGSEFDIWSRFCKINLNTSFIKKINTFKQYCKKNALDFNQIKIRGGTVLDLLSLRKSDDIDVIYYEDYKSNDFLYDFSKPDDLNALNKNYFLYHGLKFETFSSLYNSKKNSSDLKSKKDFELLQNINTQLGLYDSIRNRYDFEFLKFKRRFLNLLKDLKIYDLIRKIYRIIVR